MKERISSNVIAPRYRSRAAVFKIGASARLRSRASRGSSNRAVACADNETS